jgi:hypothetical protein
MDDADERRISLTIRMVLELQVAQGIASGGNQPEAPLDMSSQKEYEVPSPTTRCQGFSRLSDMIHWQAKQIAELVGELVELHIGRGGGGEMTEDNARQLCDGLVKAGFVGLTFGTLAA